MRRELLVPKLGLTMSEGILMEWMVQPGDQFKADQSLFVIESEKAANEVGAEGDGVLLEIVAQAGETLPCGAVIGYWDDGQEGKTSTSDSEPVTANAVTPAIASTEDKPSSSHSQATFAAKSAGSELIQKRVSVTPLARRLAAQQGVDLHGLVGSGPNGRIRARDVVAVSETKATVTEPTDIAASAPVTAVNSPELAVSPIKTAAEHSRGTLRVPTNLELTIAQRLTAAKQQVPHFYLSVEAEVSAVMSLRRQLNEDPSRTRLTLNHFVLAAVGRALEAMPEINCVWTEDGILNLAQSDVGMAVNTAKGLLVPVLRSVGQQSLGGIARQSGELIGRVQAGRLGSADMQGGAITVSNAGMHDVTYMSSIINPGQSMILGVGSIREVFRPDAEGRPEIRREMGMVLSVDHRVLDGVRALAFLKQVVDGLSKPMNLLVA